MVLPKLLAHFYLLSDVDVELAPPKLLFLQEILFIEI